MNPAVEGVAARRPGFWRRFWRHRPAFAGFFFLVCLATVVGVGPMIHSTSSEAIDLRARLTGPSVAHPLGTDEFGRDIASLVLHGSRVSLQLDG